MRTTAWAQASEVDKERLQQPGSLSYWEHWGLIWDWQTWAHHAGATGHKAPALSFSLFSVACCYPDNKNNHTKLEPTRSFCPQPTSWVVGMGLEWEAGGGQCHWEEMQIGSEREVPQKKEK